MLFCKYDELVINNSESTCTNSLLNEFYSMSFVPSKKVDRANACFHKEFALVFACNDS